MAMDGGSSEDKSDVLKLQILYNHCILSSTHWDSGYLATCVCVSLFMIKMKC